MMENGGYRTITTFYQDLTIAEFYGVSSIKETFRRICKEWLTNCKYFTEFVIDLNWKIWEHYKINKPLAELYNGLWEEADKLAIETYVGEEASYYFSTTD